jgi:hypothetical protein
MRSIFKSALVMTILSTSGCSLFQDPGYGSEKKRVYLDTYPSQREIFVVDDQKWFGISDKAAFLKDPDRTRGYRRGFSPQTPYLDPVKQVLIAIPKPDIDHTSQPYFEATFTPGVDGRKVIEITPPPPVTP